MLPSSSIDNASESSSVVLDSDFADAEEGRGHGTAVPLAEALTGPDGTAAKKQRKRRTKHYFPRLRFVLAVKWWSWLLMLVGMGAIVYVVW